MRKRQKKWAEPMLLQHLSCPFLRAERCAGKPVVYFFGFSMPTSSTSKINVEKGLILPDWREP